MADNPGETIVTKSYKTVVETFSIWAAVSFVVSGVVSAITFWVDFRLNYFSVAQPSDIVMSGFINVSMVLVLAAMAATIVFIHAKNKVIFRYFLQKTPLPRPIDLSNEEIQLIAEKQSRYFNRLMRWFNIVGITIVIVGQVILAVVDVTVDFHGVRWIKRERTTFWQRPLPRVAHNRLYLSTSSDQFEACGQAPVLWMGSATVILNCHGRLRLIQNTENLLLERLSPDEAKAAAQAEVQRATAIGQAARGAHDSKVPVIKSDAQPRGVRKREVD